MMNLSAAANAACDEFPYVPSNAGAAPPSLLPIMEQESSIQREHHHQLGYNLEANSLALLPPSNAAAHHHATTIAGHSPHDILQFYPASASHYLASAGGGGNPYSHFSAGTGGSTFHQSPYYPPAAPEYYFHTLVSSAEENMASFASTQLGLNLGYRTYFPPRGGYTYGHHPPRCQAEGCKADLSSAKRYHRRHKVCEHHSKAPVVVTAGGLHQRFCQQCSSELAVQVLASQKSEARLLSSKYRKTLYSRRTYEQKLQMEATTFHLLDEFDDAKKSCRKRLADHNRRRRKSKPSDADAGDKKRAHANKAAAAKDKAGSSSKSMDIGDGLGTQILGSALLSKEQDQAMDLGEVVKEAVDPKGKASMQQHHGIHQQHHGFPFHSSSAGSCFPQTQAVSSDTTSNIAQVQEPSLGFHHQHHQHSNILQLGQAMFDLDFDH